MIKGFHEEDFVTYGGRAVHRSIIYDKIKTLGWNVEDTQALTDEQVRQVVAERLQPGQIQIYKTNPGSSAVLSEADYDHDEDDLMSKPDVPPVELTTPGLQMETAPPIPAGRRLTGVKKPGEVTVPKPVASSQPVIGKTPAPEPTPAPTPAPTPPPPPKPTLPKPATDWNQVIALLDAVKALTGNEVTYKQASGLCQAHGLWQALKAYDEECYHTLSGDSYLTNNEEDTCIGGIILKAEVANGAIHILTTSGTLTLTGNNLNLCKQEQ